MLDTRQIHLSDSLQSSISTWRKTLVRSLWASFLMIGLAGSLTPFQARSADSAWPPPGMVGWWSGNNNALDQAGTNNGTLSNGVAFVAGEVGQAFCFNGSNSFVEVPDSPSLRLTNEVTIEFWVQRQRFVPEVVMEKGGDLTGASQNYGVSLLGADDAYALEFHCRRNGWGVAGPTDTNWHHCALVARNGEAAPVIYLDGVEKPLVYRFGSSAINLFPSTRPLHIGAQVDPAAGWNYFSQLNIDELAIFGRALAASEIQAIYSAGNAGKYGPPVIDRPPQSQVGFWHKAVTFNVQALGLSPFAYQWFKNGIAIDGATASSLSLTNLDFSAAGGYSVRVSNVAGSTMSETALLTINPAGVTIALYPGITVDGVVGLTYGIQYTTDPGNTNSWRGLANLTLTEPMQTWLDIQPATQPMRYYRVLPGPISIP